MPIYNVSCKACGRTYDGNAQCCFEMDHVPYLATSLTEQIAEIREMVKSNPELLDRLDKVAVMVTDTQNATDAWCSRTADDEERTTKENEELKRVMVDHDQEIELLHGKLDNSYGDIHALQVQNHILKMEIQNRDTPEVDGNLTSISQEEMKAFVLFCTDRQPCTPTRCETMTLLLFDEWNMLSGTEKQVFYNHGK